MELKDLSRPFMLENYRCWGSTMLRAAGPFGVVTVH